MFLIVYPSFYKVVLQKHKKRLPQRVSLFILKRKFLQSHMITIVEIRSNLSFGGRQNITCQKHNLSFGGRQINNVLISKNQH